MHAAGVHLPAMHMYRRIVLLMALPASPLCWPVLQAPQLKYRLPSDPGVWVDLLDDEDVAVSHDLRHPAQTFDG